MTPQEVQADRSPDRPLQRLECYLPRWEGCCTRNLWGGEGQTGVVQAHRLCTDLHAVQLLYVGSSIGQLPGLCLLPWVNTGNISAFPSISSAPSPICYCFFSFFFSSSSRFITLKDDARNTSIRAYPPVLVVLQLGKPGHRNGRTTANNNRLPRFCKCPELYRL